jgi:hypothetical protein
MFGASEEMHVEHLQNNALNIVEAICNVIAQPVEIILRPWYGTRYYPVPVSFFSATLMLMLPVIAAVFTSVAQMIPFVRIPLPVGVFGFAALEKLYFLLMAVHGWRLWRRMLHMELEQHSEFEGPPLPFFQLLPKSQSFWFTRIVLEPAFVFLLAIVLEDFYIVQSPLGLYLKFAAFALMVKTFIAWFNAWSFLRQAIDTRNSAPILAKLVENQATEEDLATLHIASFPKNVDPEIRQSAAVHLARVFTAEK